MKEEPYWVKAKQWERERTAKCNSLHHVHVIILLAKSLTHNQKKSTFSNKIIPRGGFSQEGGGRDRKEWSQRSTILFACWEWCSWQFTIEWSLIIVATFGLLLCDFECFGSQSNNEHERVAEGRGGGDPLSPILDPNIVSGQAYFQAAVNIAY